MIILVSCLEKSVSPVWNVWPRKNFHAIRPQRFLQACVAIRGVEIGRIIYGSHLLIADQFFGGADPAGMEHVVGKVDTEVVVANSA